MLQGHKKPVQLHIVGVRGVPAQHGGFETFAAKLAPYLAKEGWKVTVYCQESGKGKAREDSWEGVRRVHIPVGIGEQLRQFCSI
ncbi:hypothetical protein GF1_21190 [Desulfolithobacter dissulfuricans]|uniref:DUF1972 domain-containing protein n=1 Tax=Desulfolithobacter dissulfuricans TaxID=2795293 RepID=A0A915U1K9_9BACT|nr:hypothetical protein GF1_21190 [Desulfolithobacter dissulfuricans]